MIRILLVTYCLALSPVLQAQSQGNLDYVVTCRGKVITNQGETLENQIFFSVSKFSNKRTMTAPVIVMLKAVSDCSKDVVNRNPIDLPDVIYSSVRHVAKNIFVIKKSKTKKEFDSAVKKYRLALNDTNEVVAVLGYELIEESYQFNKGEIKTLG